MRGLEVGGEPVGDDQAGSAHQRLEVVGPTDGYRHVAHGVFDDQVPADHPGDQFAQRGVGIGVGRPRNGHQRGEFGVAQGHEGADHRRQHEGEHEPRAGSQPVYVSRRRRADGGEDARSDDGADAQQRDLHRPQHAAKSMLPILGVLQDGVEGFDGEDARHGGKL